MNYAEDVLALLNASPSPFHAVKNMEDRLLEAGFIRLEENKPFRVEKGKGYFLTRNGSSVLAFYVPKDPERGFCLAATHNDSPTFAVKPNPFMNRGENTMLNVEPYGGALYYPWLDRPLSLAGRVFTLEEGQTQCHLVSIDEDLLVIPSLAIHQNREVNRGYDWNAAKDMVPLFTDGKYEGNFASYLKEKLSLPGEVLSFDLSLYVREKARIVGEKRDLVLAPRLDDLSSAYASLLAFVQTCKDKPSGYIPLFVSFDNEEVGSLTAQGANSDFLAANLSRLCLALGWNEEEKRQAIASSILLSVDNAHASHPNHMDKCDPTSIVNLNAGIVLKYNADQKYTTNGQSAAYVKALCLDLGQPYQEFTNRSDLRGGSTLGNISNSEISLLSADIGIAQLAMHSPVELCGLADIDRMADLLQAHFSK